MLMECLDKKILNEDNYMKSVVEVGIFNVSFMILSPSVNAHKWSVHLYSLVWLFF